MKEFREQTFLNSTLYFFIYFIVYWGTALPAELYDVGEEKSSFYEFCHVFNLKLFFLLQYFYGLGIHLKIGGLITFILALLIMALFTNVLFYALKKTILKVRRS